MSIFTIFRNPPPFVVWHSHPGRQSQVLITAGVDGDEYAGIEAARLLTEQFTNDPPAIPITIIPTVNLAGNAAGVSQNPLDGRFPKTIFPGNPLGTSSSRLMYQVSKHTKGVKLWLDLHGGAHDEQLNSFVWADQTGNINVDNLTSSLLLDLDATTLYTRHTLTPSLPLARQGTSYLVFESGELGQVSKSGVDQHLSWVNTSITNLKANSSKPKSFSPTYTHIHYHLGRAPTGTKDLLYSSPTYFATAS